MGCTAKLANSKIFALFTVTHTINTCLVGFLEECCPIAVHVADPHRMN